MNVERRWITRQEQHLYTAMLLGLDQPSRCSRFGCGVADASLMAFANHVWASHTPVRGAFAGGSLQGVAEFFEPGGRHGAEISLAVAPPWRNRGIGTALLVDNLAAAEAAGCEVVQLTFQRSNWPMRKMMMKLDARLDTWCGEIQAEIFIHSSRWRSLLAANAVAARAKPAAEMPRVAQPEIGGGLPW